MPVCGLSSVAGGGTGIDDIQRIDGDGPAVHLVVGVGAADLEAQTGNLVLCVGSYAVGGSDELCNVIVGRGLRSSYERTDLRVGGIDDGDCLIVPGELGIVAARTGNAGSYNAESEDE